LPFIFRATDRPKALRLHRPFPPHGTTSFVFDLMPKI
jgi:hypothetical protein